MAFFSYFNILTSFSILIVFLTYQLEAYYTPNTGCHHNGTWYADKSLVPTTEKCLNCQCNKKTLVCRLKVCPEMPMPPPRGCVVVQKKNTCCPYLSCARLDAFYKIPATRRIIAYLDHYERESIDRVVNENMLQRRSDDTEVDLYVCVKNGTVYKSGSAMSSSNLCSYCYCIGGTEKCVKPKCMLPVDGCKPIFVDSTCCPVRYDCSSKQTGKSSQEVRYRKTSNKHYMRMSQRLQRNHGCTVDQQFYTEGQKMKSDKDKPCDICFCIRGQRKCAPKKCAPALRNCIPVVPKGQCCPSSYDCGSQRDYRRSQKSRQFDLFSLIFGKDDDQDENPSPEIPVQYPHDREPIGLSSIKHKESTTDKSFYDTIREGLEFIDNHNKQMLKDNIDLVDLQSQQTHHIQARPSPTPIPLSMHNIVSSTELSFLDLLLGPSDLNRSKIIENSTKESNSVIEETTPSSNTLNWVELLLGSDEEDMDNTSSTISHKIHKTDTTNLQNDLDFESTTTIDRIDKESLMDSEENIGELPAEQQEMLTTYTMDIISTTEALATDETTQDTATSTVTETTETVPITQPSSTKRTTIMPHTVSRTTRKSAAASTTSKPHKLTSTTTTSKTTNKSVKPTNVVKKTKLSSTKSTENLKQNKTVTKPIRNSDFFTQLLDGLSDILGRDNKTRHTTQQQTATHKLDTNKTDHLKLPMPKPLPLFKPLPLDKNYTRINSKIANLTVRPPIVSTKDNRKPTFKPLPIKLTTSASEILKTSDKTPSIVAPAKTTAAATTTTSTTSTPPTTTIATHLTLSTVEPVVIKTNPTILESDPLDQGIEPTLPPSLPNLKIIPFLPTDAVKSDNNQISSYKFYHHTPAPISRIDYDLYDDANIYPSITEKYPLYPDLEDGSKAEYIYKFNVEGPDSMVSSNAGKFDGTLSSPAFLKYDFPGAAASSTSINGFSPPTKTEGGFIPKDPLILNEDDQDNVSVKVSDSYQVAQHIIDITTSESIMNTTKVIEITTPDPFKDVLHTEPPPDLSSLIEDKLKNMINKSNTMAATATRNRINDKPYNSTKIEIYSMQANEKPLTLKTRNKEELPATHNEYYIKHNNTQNKVEQQNIMQHGITQAFDDDLHDEANVDVNDVSTIPPFKSLPTAQELAQEYTNTASKQFTKSHTSNTQKQTITTTSPNATKTIIPTIQITTIAATKGPAAAAVFKVNSNKTIAMTATKQAQQGQQGQQLQPKHTKINTNSALNTTEIEILPSSLSSSSAGSVSTVKTKSNATRRVSGTKPTTFNKLTTNTILPTAAPLNSISKINTINIVATRKTPKPTTNANIETLALPKTTMIPSEKTTSLPSSTSLLQRVPSANPFFMSPFDKLPFMDASFEVKRNSATPSTTTATTQQHFAVAANIAANDLLNTAFDEHNYKDEADDSFSSSRHNLMGLVHYKHTHNQLEGLEPTMQQRPHHSSDSHFLTTTQMNSRVSSPLSTTSQQHSQQSSTLNNLIDPTGILKLAGCNIYGRMYRVGRIILELSSPCLECKCTEIGVKCAPLTC